MISNFNVQIENKVTINDKNSLFINQGDLNKQDENEFEVEKSKINLKEYFDKQDEELIKLNTTPKEINYVNIPIDSFEVEVDLVNHITDSGGLERLKLEIKDKNLK